MFSKNKIPANPTAKFYQVPAEVEEVQSGYMYKSPSQTFFRSLKSWKRRFFVLSMINPNQYEMKFYRDENRRQKPLGQINLHQVSLFFRNIESQPLWLWILRNFRCSASCVLYMRVSDRDYFLIGENSTEMDDWFNAIFKALNTQSPMLPEETRTTRSVSEPVNILYHDEKLSEDQEEEQPKPSLLSARTSAPASFDSQYSHYDYPKNYMMTALHVQESEDTEEDEEDEMNKERETDGDYMDMDRVREVLRQNQNEDVLIPQTKMEGNNVSENSLCQTGKEKSGSPALNRNVSSASETFVPVEKEICVSQNELKNSVIFSEEAGKLCVSNWKHNQYSGLFHEGDQILAINDLLTESLVELQSYLKRASKDQVKLTIRRQPGSQPLSGCYV